MKVDISLNKEPTPHIHTVMLYMCGPMLITEPNVVCLLVTVLVVAVVFVTTTLASDYLLCQVLPYPRCV